MPEIGINLLSVVPMRAEASDKSEMVSQILFGERYSILRKNKKWTRVKTLHDKYEGWIDNKQVYLSGEDKGDVKASSSFFVGDLVSVAVNESNNEMTPVLLGSCLPDYKDEHFRLGEFQYKLDSEVIHPAKDKDRIVETAYMYLNAPYLWGGRTPFGIDCSGFTQMVYRINGIDLPRDAKDQAEKGQVLSFIEESEPGDLAFFDNEEGLITHVGIVLSDHHIIHASGRVRIDRIDQHGIFNHEERGHTHKLRLIKKIM
jgi:cell wall-associated NlpC family hydrolase